MELERIRMYQRRPPERGDVVRKAPNMMSLWLRRMFGKVFLREMVEHPWRELCGNDSV